MKSGFTFTLAIVTLGVLAACAGGEASRTVPSSPVAESAASFVDPGGRLVRSAFHTGREAIRDSGRIPKTAGDLFVSLISTDDVGIFKNRSWKEVGTIATTGMSCPNGAWVDRKGDLYVVNIGNSVCTPGVYEFKPGTSTPSFVYTTGLVDPVNVETDNHGNVYVMDFLGAYLDEYQQGSNSLLYQCRPPSSGYNLVAAAAIDRHGNVFMVSTNYPAPWSTYLYEYVGGLKGCSATQLAVFSNFFAGGMVLDKKANLLLVDQNNEVVNVIPPPYKTIGSQISAFDAFSVTINRKNDQIYVTSEAYGSASGGLFIDAYPSGKNIATLGPSNGISNPGGAVDTLNYVP